MWLFALVPVQISGNVAVPTIGRSFILTCGTFGTEDQNVTSYQWKKDTILLHGQVGPILSFSPLRLSDVGN